MAFVINLAQIPIGKIVQTANTLFKSAATLVYLCFEEHSEKHCLYDYESLWPYINHTSCMWNRKFYKREDLTWVTCTYDICLANAKSRRKGFWQTCDLWVDHPKSKAWNFPKSKHGFIHGLPRPKLYYHWLWSTIIQLELEGIALMALRSRMDS